MKTTAIIAFALCIAASAAHAIDTYTIAETVPESAVSTVSQAADIIGIHSGMSAADARALIGKEYGGEDKVETLSVQFGTRQVQSQKFALFLTSEVAYNKGRTEVYLTSPISGNRVFAANRRVDFKIEDGLPKIEALKQQLTEKYGTPSAVDDKRNYLFWYLGDKGECNGDDVCSWSYDGGQSGGAGGVLGSYDIAMTEKYEAATKYGADIIVVAKISPAYDYPDSVKSFSVSFVDVKLRAASARADLDLVMQKQAEFDAKSVAMPKL